MKHHNARIFQNLAALLGVVTFAALLSLLTSGCDSSSSGSSGAAARAAVGNGFLAVVNITARDFEITLTGADVVQTNEVVSTQAQPVLTTNVTTAADGVTLVTNVVNNPIDASVTNASVEVVAPEPISHEAPRNQTSVFPLPPNTYRAVFQVKGGMRTGEISVIINEDARTQVNVLLDPDTETGLQLSSRN